LREQRKNRNIRAELPGDAGAAAASAATCVILTCVGFVLENWLQKVKSPELERAVGNL